MEVEDFLGHAVLWYIGMCMQNYDFFAKAPIFRLTFFGKNRVTRKFLCLDVKTKTALLQFG